MNSVQVRPSQYLAISLCTDNKLYKSTYILILLWSRHPYSVIEGHLLSKLSFRYFPYLLQRNPPYRSFETNHIKLGKGNWVAYPTGQDTKLNKGQIQFIVC